MRNRSVARNRRAAAASRRDLRRGIARNRCMHRLVPAAVVFALLAGCGGSAQRPPQPRADAASRQSDRSPHRPRQTPHPADPEALVTAETVNQLVIVDLRTGRVLRRMAMPPGPRYVAAEPGAALVTSPTSGAVTLLQGGPFRKVATVRGLGTPDIIAIAPDGEHAYFTDGVRGTSTVMLLGDPSHRRTIEVGAGAHHLASTLYQERLWIALGESAHVLAIVDTSNIDRPRVIGHFDPGFAAHDVGFSPDGVQVWISASDGPDVSVFSVSGHRLLFRVPAGPPPQHIAFDGDYAYLTSGYGSTIERVWAATGRIMNRASAPYGSFELAARDGYVVTASLLNGQLAIYTPQLRRLRTIDVAPATRDVEIYP